MLPAVQPITLDPAHAPPILPATGGMAELAGLFCERLHAAELEHMAEFARSGPLSVGSICSGSDVAAHCHAALADALRRKTDIEPLVQMAFACEKDPQKASFLAAMHPQTKLIFAEAGELCQRIALDTKTATKQAVPSVTGICAGFPCTDVSRLNKFHSSSSNMSCAASQTMRTGAVFGSIIRYLKEHNENISFAILENVTTLATPPKKNGVNVGPSNLDVCIYDLRHEADMVTAVFRLDPRILFGQLTSRPRLYMVCIKAGLLHSAGLSEDDFMAAAKRLMEKLIMQPRIFLESVLLDDKSAPIEEYLESLKQMPAKKRKVLGDWSTKHCKTFGDTGSSWWAPSDFRAPDAIDRFPGLLALTPRQLDLLERYNLRLPEETPGVLDVNPSIGFAAGGVATNSAPCLCSTSMLYLTHRGRLAHGVEHLRMVGFFADADKLAAFPSTLLKDLAGNAFDGASYMATFCVTYAILADVHHRRSHRARLARISDVFAGIWSQGARALCDSDSDLE